LWQAYYICLSHIWRCRRPSSRFMFSLV
jgi:hypothetical protein